MKKLSRWLACSDAKSFLPAMIGSGLPLHATPITEHIMACQACQRDIIVLERLRLSTRQLYGLAVVLAGDKNILPVFPVELLTDNRQPERLPVPCGLIDFIRTRSNSGLTTYTTLVPNGTKTNYITRRRIRGREI